MPAVRSRPAELRSTRVWKCCADAALGDGGCVWACGDVGRRPEIELGSRRRPHHPALADLPGNGGGPARIEDERAFALTPAAGISEA
jgi:hypothetical protein